MSDQREAFKSCWQLGFAHLEVPDDCSFEIWQAAQVEMQKEWGADLFKQCNTLKHRNFKLEAESETTFAHCKHLEKQLLERDAVIERVSDILKTALCCENMSVGTLTKRCISECLEISTTPSESLAKHDAEVAAKARDEENEACFEIAKSMDSHCADKIRARRMK